MHREEMHTALHILNSPILSVQFSEFWLIWEWKCESLSRVQLLQPHGSSVHVIFQARILKGVAIPFSSGCS